MHMKTKPQVIASVAAQTSPKCPACGVAIGLQATVGAFLENPQWHFWGVAGQRWKRCEGNAGRYGYVHFTATVNERRSERLAWILQGSDSEMVQGQLMTEKQNDR